MSNAHNNDYQPNNGKSSTFGRRLMNYVGSKMPYYNQAFDVAQQIERLNPKYRDFHQAGLRRQEVLAKHSVSSSNKIDITDPAVSMIGAEQGYGDVVYANVQEDKIARLRDYRVMSAFAEVANALDEICDECINEDENGEIVRLSFRHHGLDLKAEKKKTIEREFCRFVGHFELEHKGWEYFRALLMDAEIYFEHIIHEKHEEEGILGVVSIPTELIDPIFGNVQNQAVKGYLLRRPIFDREDPRKVKDYEMIPMQKNQITYVNSGIWDESKTLRLPHLENARRAYRQLTLIEDAIVIYRLVRAPERLVFNVDVGNMPPPKAEAYLRKLMQQYWSSKTFDINQNGIVNKFNPQSMLDSFWFAKRSGGEGTSVESLAGGQNLGELDDLLYFQRKLYESLKVPTNRLNTESTADGAEILREELRFANFIVRLQQRFAIPLKSSFVSHLQLKGIWDNYELREEDLHIQFNVPTNFYELREAQRMELRFNNFNTVAANEFVSTTYAMKKYLKWSDTEVKANRQFLRNDTEFQWEIQQITAGGPNWRDNIEAGAAAAGMEGGIDSGVPPTGGGGSPLPEFGGGPANISGSEPIGEVPNDTPTQKPPPAPGSADSPPPPA